MKKFGLIKTLIFLLFVFVLPFFITGCSESDKGLIFFNSEPVTEKNLLPNHKTFHSGDRIYYLFVAPKKMNNEFIRVQVFKMTDKAPWGGHEMKRTKDYRLMQDERYYHTNYFVLYETGRYVMQVFSHADLLRPLAVNDFYVN